MNASVPEGLSQLLEEFAIAVLKEKPNDLVAFAAGYFNDLVKSRDCAKCLVDGTSALGNATPVEDKMNSEGDSDVGHQPSHSYRQNMDRRRKSVFAEPYDPSAHLTHEKIIHPKSDDQRARLVQAVRKVFLFGSLDIEQTKDVLDAMFEKRVTAGEQVVVQGDDGDNFYVIDSGVFEVYVSNNGMSKPVFHYNNEGCFGELALMYNTPRAATVVAATPGVLWALDRHTFRRIICDAACRKRQTYQIFLESVPMLRSLEPYELMNLADGLQRRMFGDMECIIKQGDKADAFYIVEEGTVCITKEDPHHRGNSVRLSTCGKGSYFGELALLTHKPRAASVHAVGPVTCAVLDVAAFERLLGPCMDIMKRNFEHYEEQLMQLFGTTMNITDYR